jgi:hypothetical protein
VKRVSCDINCPPINYPDQYPATAHTLAADCRNPFFNPRGIQFFYGGEFGPLQKTAPQGNCNSSPTPHLQKISTAHLHRKYPYFVKGIEQCAWYPPTLSLPLRGGRAGEGVINSMPSAPCAVLFSDMACQTVGGQFFFGMTVHTPAHRHLDKWFRRRYLTLTDLSMTGLTL